MKQWVISVAAIALLSVLADIILPNGQTRKYIKTVIGIVVTLVIVQPVVQIIGNKQDGFAAVAVDYQAQQQYLDYVADVRDCDSENLRRAFVQAGFVHPTVVFDLARNVYLVTFTEGFSSELLAKAQQAADEVKCKYFVKYVWGN